MAAGVIFLVLHMLFIEVIRVGQALEAGTFSPAAENSRTDADNRGARADGFLKVAAHPHA